MYNMCQCNMPQNTLPQVLQGNLYCTNDPGAVQDALACGFAIIALVDIDQEARFRGMPNTVVMSNLLPSAEAISSFINGDINGGFGMYLQYLSSPEREESVVCILQALYGHRQQIKFSNYLLYAEFEPDQDFHILDTLRMFFFNSFGINIGYYKDPNNPAFNVSNEQFNYAIANLLFTNGKITKEEFAMYLPVNSAPTDSSCALLLNDLQYQPRSLEDALRVCCSYVNQIRDEISTGRTSPFVRVSKCMDDKVEKDITKRVMESKTRFGDK